jgi:hypothetical protein
VASIVVDRDTRAGQDELPWLIGVIVDVAPHVVPDARHQLPFVDEARPSTVEKQSRIHESGSPGLLVSIETNDAPGGSQRGLGLAATAWPLDEDGARRPQAHGKLVISEARKIALCSPKRGLAGIRGTHL